MRPVSQFYSTHLFSTETPHQSLNSFSNPSSFTNGVTPLLICNLWKGWKKAANLEVSCMAYPRLICCPRHEYKMH